ncbi:MAG TPA: hypothetical protein DCZ94_08890 [Lentisphaeria bacterium]|nr:MAG: hypothetical protein A2X48_23510 [Lentisphaerae bacterium GWF2_49_21]HBC87056.1 hypothetical protein [Lentisphaeria bacterium]
MAVNGFGKAVRMISKCLLALSILALASCGTERTATVSVLPDIPSAEGKNSSTVRNISYSFTLENTTNRPLPKVDFWTFAPIGLDDAKKGSGISSSYRYEALGDELGNTILHFVFQDVAPFQKIVLTIKVQVPLSGLTPSDATCPPERFLKPEKNIESDAPEIIRLAGTLGNPRKVYEWVSGNIAYEGYSPQEKGAMYALRNRKGDCTESAFLFTALCRASGIPSRTIGGYVCSKDAVISTSSYHNWAEYRENGSWHIADPQKRIFDGKREQFIATNILGSAPDSPMSGFSRFRILGDGMKAEMH